MGLGKEAARHFVGLNAQIVILACRSVEKGEAAKKDIESTTKRAGVVEVWQLDLGSYNSPYSGAWPIAERSLTAALFSRRESVCRAGEIAGPSRHACGKCGY